MKNRWCPRHMSQTHTICTQNFMTIVRAVSEDFNNVHCDTTVLFIRIQNSFQY